MKKVNLEQIMEILPHRPPMLLIEEGEPETDRPEAGQPEADPGIDSDPGTGAAGTKTSVCRYTVKGDEFFLQGHFPGNPVVPGVIQCEMMAQASCLLVEQPQDGKIYTPYFTGMDKVKFKRKVVPGDTITLRSTLTRQKGAFYFVSCTGHVDNELCCRAEISFALA